MSVAKRPTSVEDLRPAPYNPRDIDPESLAALKTSLGEFGDLSGFTWNARSGFLVTGHQRLRALREEHGDAVRLRRAGKETFLEIGGERFRVRVVDWDEETEKAANIAANSPLLAGIFADPIGDLLAEVSMGDRDLYEALRMQDLAIELGLGGDWAGAFDAASASEAGGTGFRQMTFMITDEQHTVVKEAIARAAQEAADDAGENRNRNGNALTAICEAFLR